MGYGVRVKGDLKRSAGICSLRLPASSLRNMIYTTNKHYENNMHISERKYELYCIEYIYELLF